MAKVKAHSGEPMNELADARAAEAAEVDEMHQLILDPCAVHFLFRGILVEWNTRLKHHLTQAAATRHLSSLVARRSPPGAPSDVPRAPSKTATWMLRQGQGRSLLGRVLRSAPVNFDLKQAFQTISNMYPSRARLFQWKLADAPTCLLCGQGEESQSHIQCFCPVLKGARIRAHHHLAQQLWAAIARGTAPGFEFHAEMTVSSLRGLAATPEWYHIWQRMCDDLEDQVSDSLEHDETDPHLAGGLGSKRPDAWAVNWGAAQLYILEFTRPSDTAPDWDTSTDTYKRTKYEPIRNRISSCLPAWTVEILTFSLGIRGSFNESTWTRNLEVFGVSGLKAERVMLDLIELGLHELSAIYRVRQAALPRDQNGSV